MRLWILGMLALVFVFLSGCSLNLIVDDQGNRIPLAAVFDFVSDAPDIIEFTLVAKLTGSIYETGDFITVFGTCLTSLDEPVDTNVSLRVFYPNGTNFIDTANLSGIETGYWLYTDTMYPTIGTYLTEFKCTLGDDSAIAYGEWQNPVWVNRLLPILQLTNSTDMIVKDINGTVIGINTTVTEINTKIDNLSINVNIGNISVNMSCAGDGSEICDLINQGFNDTNQSFQIAFTKLDNLNVTIVDNFNYTNWLIQNINISNQINLTYGICVANASVDRNDSYLASVLRRVSRSVGAPVNYALDINMKAKFPFPGNDWIMKAYVFDEYGDWATDGDGIYCNITLLDNGVNTTYNMTWIPGRGCSYSDDTDVDSDDDSCGTPTQCKGQFKPPTCTKDMERFGFWFYHYQEIKALDFNWWVSCGYNDREFYEYPQC